MWGTKVEKCEITRRNLEYSMCEEEFSQHESFVAQHFRALSKFLVSILFHVFPEVRHVRRQEPGLQMHCLLCSFQRTLCPVIITCR